LSEGGQTASGKPAQSRRLRLGWLTEIRLAAGFLTIAPVMPRVAAPPDTVAASLGWFPLVGFILGGVLIIEDFLLDGVFGRPTVAVLLILTLAVLSGAIHLDALADSADALSAASDPHRALEIMRDSRIGSFGAIAIFFLLALEILALAATPADRRVAALWLAPGLARWAMAAVSWRVSYVRSEGAGTVLLQPGGDRNLILATVIAAIAAVPVFSMRVLAAYGVALVLSVLLQLAYRRWVGGVTGDLIGAAGEIVELTVLLLMAAAC
jgi:adenosylcobinamide-GDP ribazoletransferase